MGGRRKPSACRGALKQYASPTATTVAAVDILLRRDADALCLVVVAGAADADAASDDVFCNDMAALPLPLAEGLALRRQLWDG